jgi:chromosomal replication initiator protein
MPPSEHSGEHDVQRILSRLSETIGPRRFRHWFEGKTRLSLQGDLLHVEAASHYLLSWIQRQYGDALLAVAHELVHPGLRVHFEVDAGLSLHPATTETEEGRAWPAAPGVGRTTRPRPERRSGGLGATDCTATLGVTDRATRPGATERTVDAGRRPATAPSGRRQYDLRDFVVGQCNQLAYTAARAVAASPGAAYNPLYVYGTVGNGKTHLLEGIAREIKRGYPALQVLFLTAENFTNFFTRALREKSLPSFRQKFRGADVLLVDDVDFLEGKRSIQEEFLHTLQQLDAHGRQVVLTGDRHPRMLTRLSDELVTRFLSGLVCRIESPSTETRRQVVERIASERRLQVSEGALEYVTMRFTGSVRELVGAMNCLAVWQSLYQLRIGKTVAREVLASLERDCLRIVRLDDIDKAVCDLFGVTSRDLKSESRSRTVAQPRMLAMYLARRLTNTALSEIGRFYGGRNHSTVLSAERKVAQLVERNETIRLATEEWTVRDVLQTLEQQILSG